MDYAGIIGRAWRITWQNKALWLFGILAALGQGRASLNLNTQRWSQAPEEIKDLGLENGERALEAFEKVPLVVWGAIICVALIILVGVWILAALGQAGLIGGVRVVEAQGRVSFGEAWTQATTYLGRVLLIQLIMMVVSLVVVIVSVLPSLLLTAISFGLCLFPLVCIAALVSAAIHVFGSVAQVAAISDDLRPGAALGRAWELLSTRATHALVLALILFFLGLIAGFVLGLPMLIALAPLLGGGVVALLTQSEAALGAGAVVAVACVVVYLPVLLLGTGILTAWSTSSWTLAYRTWSTPPQSPVAADQLLG